MWEDDPFGGMEQQALEELSEAVREEDASQAWSTPGVLSQVIGQVSCAVAERRCSGLWLIDTTQLEGWERQQGAGAFDGFMGRLFEAVERAKGERDVVCLEGEGGDTVVVFVMGDAFLGEREMARLSTELLGGFERGQMVMEQALERVALGSAMVLPNASVDPRRQVYRAIRRARGEAQEAYHDQQRRRSRVVGHLIAQRKIRTLYQPVVRLKDRRVEGYEALSRADGGEAQRLGVHLFVAASRAELEGELDQACRMLSVERRPPIGEEGRLFLNCLPPTFYASNPELKALLQGWGESGMRPEQLVFEVTEQITYEQFVRIMPTVRTLREEGYRFALDDVGTGAANLRLLAELEPDYIKMDLELTRGIARSERKRALAHYLQELAIRSGAELIAEGIETFDDLEVLESLGVALGQGYLLGEPREASAWWETMGEALLSDDA
ncbi:hypothetical protein DL240_07220 [Lujinxingia litoralis]|uniref:EAL domain-containing protein n=1 Tax=Lujinxingia litoralis TaxID=2211119 RepID=A0A328C8W1_9DELT|nr:EAL domain-containing protein [Lujinxingia litoralis]RAL23930.1 hypothetical protein DL240_07220 [Lujinxingia litoralis]